MTYGKAAKAAKAKAVKWNDNYVVYFDSEEGQEGYWVKQEDDFYHEADMFQSPQETFFGNGQSEAM